jgi:ADP-heptose:LPS heptosyltransferase
MKKCLVIRLGGLGDIIIMSPLLKRLKEDGYSVDLNTVANNFPLIRNNPYIDRILLQEHNLIHNSDLGEYWDAISQGYDKVINLSETLEVKFLFSSNYPWQMVVNPLVRDKEILALAKRIANPKYYLPVEERRKLSGGVNYYDYVLEHGGYTDVVEPRGELFPDEIETSLMKNFSNHFKDKFLVLWCLSGSGMHKTWLRQEEAALTFVAKHKDVVIITVGDYICKLIDFAQFAPPGTVLSRVGEWDIRTSVLMANYVDLVVSPETGILNAAGCYDTPKIGLLTHSNKTNLTKHFKNDYSIQAETECSPCHRMIYMDNFVTDCPLLGGGKEKIGFDCCACADGFNVAKVLGNMETVYRKWKESHNTIQFTKHDKPIVLYGPAGNKVYQSQAAIG